MNALTATIAAWAAASATQARHAMTAAGTLQPYRFRSLEWAAGFVDGEACIHISRQQDPGRRNPTYSLRVFITQADRSVLEHFRRCVGLDSPIYAVKHRPFHRQPVFTLNYVGAQALALVKLLLPLLVRKQAEAKAALAYWREARVGVRPGPKGFPEEVWHTRERYYQLLRDLKKGSGQSLGPHP